MVGSRATTSPLSRDRKAFLATDAQLNVIGRQLDRLTAEHHGDRSTCFQLGGGGRGVEWHRARA